jgi:triacylglycerol esterase/lipase EstA (alpha/beta hydrolase family)
VDVPDVRRYRDRIAVLAAGALALTILVAAPGPAASATAGGFAPLDRPGPALSVPEDQLAAALSCTSSAGAGRQTVLFVPGTTVNPSDNYSWNWFRALDKLGRPYCAVTLPFDTTGDIQVAAEYVVHAIRAIHARTGRRVQVLGHSQGGAVPRFALRFWPDLRGMVDDYIAFGATNHGTVIAGPLCTSGCAPAIWQQAIGSNFVQAMNSYQETFPEISYTAIYTHLDQIVQPNLDDQGSTSLHGPGEITNVAVQDLCPTDTADHIAVGTWDPVAYALAMDALDHSGPADPRRIPKSVCSEVFMPGVDPIGFAADLSGAWKKIGSSLATDPRVNTEPALKPYTMAERH